MDLQQAFDKGFALVKEYVDAEFGRVDKRLDELAARQGLDNIEADFDGERRLTLRFTMGAQVKQVEVVLPVPIDRGIWDQDMGYERGDTVSFGGSLWIAQVKSRGQTPGTSPAFRLAAKKGRDGRP